MTPVGWKALVTDWSDLVRRWSPDGFDDEALERLADRHGGAVEDTGGGIEVGFVRFRDGGTATITDEMVVLWIGDEPYVDLPAEEIFAGDVIG